TGGSQTGSSNSFTVNPAALDHFTLALATPQRNGVAFTCTNALTAQDTYGNTVTGFDASANNVTLTADSPFTGTISGLHGANVLRSEERRVGKVGEFRSLRLTYTGNTTSGMLTDTMPTEQKEQ